MKNVPLSNYRFGRLMVIGMFQQTGSNRVKILCICDCGTMLDTRKDALETGNTRSCGCLGQELRHLAKKKHEETMPRTPEYNSWLNMKDRCYNRAAIGYANYGGRGITVCERWRESYQNFLTDMGRKPSPKYTLERIRNDENYRPQNCRWATRLEQARNRRTGILDIEKARQIKALFRNGESRRSIAEKYGISPGGITNIINGVNWKEA